MNCSRNDVVLVPVPFTDLSSHKVRPAVVIGVSSSHKDLFIVPITSQLHQTSLSFQYWKAAGLNVPCGIKGQLATIDSNLVRKVIGALAGADSQALDNQLRHWLSL